MKAQSIKTLQKRVKDLEAALADLLQDTQHRDHNCGDTPEYCCVLKAQQLLGLK